MVEESVTRSHCLSECQKRDADIDKIVKILDRMTNILDGEQQNMQSGIRYQVLTMWDDYLKRRKTSMGILDWVYRAVIGVVVSWIAYRIGMGGA